MPNLLIITLKLILAIIFGWLIGFERELSGKAAGTRTYAFVALGSTLFTVIGMHIFTEYQNVDPTRIISQIIVGIGFIGAGLIIFEKHQIEGLTTAAALWTTSAVGVTIGLGWYEVSLISALLVFILLYVVGRIEYRYLKEKTLWDYLHKKQKRKWWV